MIKRTYQGSVDTLITNFPSSEFGSDSFTESFDGMVVSVTNDTLVELDLAETGWLVGASTVPMNVIPDNTSSVVSLAWPADYEIHFFDDVVANTPNFNVPVTFLVYNTTRGELVDAELFDNDQSGDLTYGDDIVIMEYIGTRFKLTWRIEYSLPGIGLPEIFPEEGDIFVIKTKKQFKSGDYFLFSTISESFDAEIAKNSLEDIKVVPNPYIATASWERRNLNSSGRGERRIDFIHLPAECTIRIFTVSGSLVKTLYKESAISDGSLSWNLISEDGMDVAYGLYIYHVDAPGVGTHIGKFVLVK